jgi:hypothetical protein
MNRVRIITLCASIVVAIVAACASPQDSTNTAANNPPSGRDCFNVQFLTGYETVDRDTLRVRAGPSASYDVDISGAQCTQIDWAHRVAIESTPSSWICVGNQPGQGSIAFRDPTTRRRVECYIDGVRRVDDTPTGS